MLRIRITFSKTGPMQYVGHLDLHRAWERAFRRSGLSIEYSQGFHPQPRLNLACALPVGFTSQCELLDAWLQQDLPVEDIASSIKPALPPGLEISTIVIVDEHQPALQTQVNSAIYRITFLDEIHDIIDRVQKTVGAEKLPRVRRNKSYDLRPLIESIIPILEKDGRPSGLRVQMATRAGSTGRPEELLDEMGIRFENTQIHREQLILIQT